NKQVVASSGPDLARLGPLRFEAAVASAIPVVEVLAATLASDRIASVTGILNGTTNVILEAMAGGGSYAVALADAQARGYAEADPSADVEGHDPAAKLTILAMLAFGKRIDPDRVERRGIGELDGAQLKDARERGAAIKLVASARDGEGDQVLADVRPRLVPLADPLARVTVSLTLDEVRERARRAPMVSIFRDMLSDALTPVTAYAAIAGDGPAFLLESVEGGERLGRYSFVGADPMAIVTVAEGRARVS